MYCSNYTRWFVVPAIAVVLLIGGGFVSGEKGSCRAARKCCDGKDADCIVQNAPLGSLQIGDLSEEPCYCDHGCLEVGDCCPDFKDYCGGE